MVKFLIRLKGPRGDAIYFSIVTIVNHQNLVEKKKNLKKNLISLLFYLT